MTEMKLNIFLISPLLLQGLEKVNLEACLIRNLLRANLIKYVPNDEKKR